MTRQRLAAILACLWLPGCVIVDTGVTNPVPGMSRIAVLPFRNLTSHPDAAVDGRRFAMTYASELQKVPGFEVVPVGVAEVALLESGVKIASPDDALELARLLNVDAVVVGAVTEYDPYYPPRVGLQVEWLSPHPWLFAPGIPVDPAARKAVISEVQKEQKRQKMQKPRSPLARFLGVPVTFRGQSEDGSADDRSAGAVPAKDAAQTQPRLELPPLPGAPPLPMLVPVPDEFVPAASPSAPIMAYSRFFDGADADLVAELRDYAELNGDLRSGGWQAYLQRSDDFIRFVCHRMIEEMLTLHGGEGRRRIVVKLRKYR